MTRATGAGTPVAAHQYGIPSWLVRIELGLAQAFVAFAILIVPYHNVSLPGWGWRGALSLAVLGGVLFWGLAWRGEVRHAAGRLLAPIEQLGLLSIVIAGVLLTATAALVTHPVLTSDPMVYLSLAEGLVQEMRYVDPDGRIAFWPPGLPLFLSPFVALFGAGFVAVVMANILLCSVSMLALYSLTTALVGRAFALRALLLFAIWPARLLASGVVSKEHLAMATVLLALALLAHALTSEVRRPLLASIGSGLCFGLASLAQPGLMLLALATPLMFWHTLARLGLANWALRLAIAIVLAHATIAPWQVRNCVVFEGRFCGISTNGGSVFYRANNPLATGDWISDGEVRISHLSELEQNDLGFEMGKAWIREHPLGFAKLAAKKIVLLLGEDIYGAYWGIQRADDNAEAPNNGSPSPARATAFEIARFVSLAAWVLLLASVFAALRTAAVQSAINHRVLSLRPLFYPLLYSCVVFTVFESGARQHMVAAAVLTALAATGMGSAARRC
jgi:hypothetical protein